MVKRAIAILETAASSVAEIAYFIEAKGLQETARKFVADIFLFFEKLADKRVVHKPYTNKRCKYLKYRCVSYKKEIYHRLSESFGRNHNLRYRSSKNAYLAK